MNENNGPKVGFWNIPGCHKFQKRFTPKQMIRKDKNEKNLGKSSDKQTSQFFTQEKKDMAKCTS